LREEHAISEALSLLRALDGGLAIADAAGEPAFLDEGARMLLGSAGWPLVRQSLEAHAARFEQTGEVQFDVALPADVGGATLSVRVLRLADGAGRLVSLRNRRALQGLQSNLLHAAQMRRLHARYQEATHDLRAPLNAVALNLELARGDLAQLNGHEPEVRSEALGRLDLVGREVARLSRMLTVLLGQSDLPRDASQLFGLHSLLIEVAALVRPQAQRQGVALRLALPSESVHMQAPRDHLKQALMNLLNNALDATPRGGHIELALECDDERARIRVSDNGSGIPAQLLEQVFRLQFITRADGTGTGLFTARGTVESMGGRLKLESVEGAGTTALVELPRAVRTQELAGEP